jgi:hypothetical protein
VGGRKDLCSLIKKHHDIVYFVKASVNPVTHSNGLPVGIILGAREWSVHPPLTPYSNATHTLRDSLRNSQELFKVLALVHLYQDYLIRYNYNKD